MNIKRQIFYGLLFLFGLSLILIGTSAYNTKKLASDSEAILKDNYNSLLFSKDMLEAGSEGNDTSDYFLSTFETALMLQQKNITEKGEKEITDSLTTLFQKIKSKQSSNSDHKKISQLIFHVMELNMKAIEMKNKTAQENARTVFQFLLIAGLLFLIIALTFIIKFPGYIASPVIKRDTDKTNLIATISHELKTPIASIKLISKLLEDRRVGELNPEQKQLITNIKEESDRLLKITGELLNMSQVETGKININITNVKLIEIVNYAIDALKTPLSEKQIYVKLVGLNESQEIKADKEKSVWVLINIFSNAIRYSPNGSDITVEVTTITNEAVVLSIKDNGTGIPKEFQSSIFQRFYRVPENKVSQGTGLGLSIAKEFMEAMGGKIELDKENKTGAKFNLQFISSQKS